MFFCLYCNKEFKSSNGKNGHSPYCRSNPNKIQAWNKGLTKETSDIVKKYTDSSKLTKNSDDFKSNYSAWNKGLTKETSDIVLSGSNKCKTTKNTSEWKELHLNKVKLKYNGLHFTQTEEYKIKWRNKHYEKYGVYNPLQRPEIHLKVLESSFKLKSYFLPSGKEVSIQGYEYIALDILFKNNYLENDIIVEAENMPILFYKDGTITRRYYPDIILKSENKIIEVKSEYTILDSIRLNKLKQKCAIDYGYSFEFWLLDKNYNKIIITDLNNFIKTRKNNE